MIRTQRLATRRQARVAPVAHSLEYTRFESLQLAAYRTWDRTYRIRETATAGIAAVSCIAAFIAFVIVAYVLKSAWGIDIFPNLHGPDLLKGF